MLLQDFFESSVRRFPDNVALVAGEVSLSYAGLHERAGLAASSLRELGVGPEARVALFLPRGSVPLYEMILGVLLAGGAYVPIDDETPAERAAFILKDSGAKILVTTLALQERLSAHLPDGVRLLRVDEPPALSSVDEEFAPSSVRPDNLCYVIYTSGTTGRPKGVMIEHQSAASLIAAESKLYGAGSEDRVLQLASPAFDASVEEMWLAWAHGAALIAADRALLASGPDFSQRAAELGVSVLSCVPTFLSMLEEDIASLRLLILGGETCPNELAARWLRPNRRVFNTYGPTETTVIATAALLCPGRPVTIGRAIAGYEVFIVDENLNPLPAGARGEIAIAGTGVARGYLNRPELEDEKFASTKIDGRRRRFYRSGDAGRVNADGELEHLGRLDDQVKLRGYRIELGEVEKALLACPGVLAAAAAPHLPTQRIAAYAVTRVGETLDRAAARAILSARLPAYMLPAFLDEVPALPLTASGKIDRARLPPPQAALASSARLLAPKNDAERVVLAAWEGALSRNGISTSDDFFADLDGHSLLAALAVSRLRREKGFERISVADLYAHPTVEGLAALARAPEAAPPPPAFRAVSRRAYAACAAGQALGVFFLAGLYAWQWLGAFLAYGYLVVADWPVDRALLGALAVYSVTTPAMLALSIALKWLLLGRVKTGRYPLWGWFYWRFWLVRAVMRAAPVSYLAGTPLINFYYRLMGARIGKDVFIGSFGLSTFDLLAIGDGSSVGLDTTLDGASVAEGWLKLAPVAIGRGVTIGNRCSLGAGAALEDGAALADLSSLPDGERVLAGEYWRGAPAAPVGRHEPPEPRAPWTWASTLRHAAGVFLFPLVILAAVFPGLMLITHLGHHDEGFTFLVVAPAVAVSFVLLLCAEVWGFKWLVVGRMREGCYPVGGWRYFGKWFFDQLMGLSLEVTGTLYTTLYLRPWLKALGARLGPRSEISTIRFIDPDLLIAGAECFLADDVLVGAPRIASGWMTIGYARVGDRAFAGNGAVLPPGTTLGHDVLIGTLSTVPERAAAAPEGSSWLGSPAIHLPLRRRSLAFSETATYRPPRRLVFLRLFIEFFRVILPSTFFVILASLIMNATDVLQDYISLGEWLLVLPLLYALAGVLAVFVSAALKFALMGRYEPSEHPLWSPFVWKSELVTGVYENFSVLFFLDLLRGTPLLAWALRVFGARVGRRVYLDTTWFTEFDLIDIEDDAALNEDANIQTHLFEDRVMKTGRVRLGARAAIGAMSTVLYDTAMAEDSALGELSLLMKGESLPPGTSWAGIPARRLSRPS